MRLQMCAQALSNANLIEQKRSNEVDYTFFGVAKRGVVFADEKKLEKVFFNNLVISLFLKLQKQFFKCN